MIYFNYVEGSITQLNQRPEMDDSVPVLKSKFTGKNLFLNPSAPTPTATIRLSGLDAQAVYTALRATGQLSTDVDQLDATAMERKGKNISCVRSLPSGTNEAVYKCTLALNAASGAVAIVQEAPVSGLAPF